MTVDALLPKQGLDRLLQELARTGELQVPIHDAGGGRFAPWNEIEVDPEVRSETLALDVATVRPAKDVLHAQTETLLRFRLEPHDFQVEEPAPTASSRVIFGLRPCDGRGFTVLDTLLLRPDYQDPSYAAARRAALLVGLGCARPGPDCFCTSVGGDPHSTAGLDVLLTDLGNEFHLEALTPRGRQWLQHLLAAGDLPLRASTAEATDRCVAVRQEARERVPRQVDVAALGGVLEAGFDHELWEHLAPACIGCGVCTYLCPTCRCYDIQDEVRGQQGRRRRCWDSCMFREYTQEAGGHNPRPRQALRWRNRLYDKFQWSGDGHGNPGCVGCGRCITYCPSGVDLVELIEAVAAEGAS